MSEEIGKSKGWLAHLENGRTKSISRSDFIKLIAYLRENADIHKTEVFPGATLTGINADMAPPKSPDEVNCESFILNFQCPNDKQIFVCLEIINKTLSRIYNKYSGVEQTAYIDALWAFLHN